MCLRNQRAEIGEAFLAHRKDDKQRRLGGVVARHAFAVVAKVHRQLGTHDWLDSLGRRLLREFQRAKQIVAVGHGKGGLGVGQCQFHQPLNRHRAFQQRKGGMNMQMDKTGAARAPPLGFLVARN